MINSSDPTLAELLSDVSFRHWVKSGAFRQNDHQWSAWIRQHPEKGELVRQAIEILSASHLEEFVSESVVDEIVAGAWDRIDRREQLTVNRSLSWWKFGASIAATISLILAGWWLLRGPSTATIKSPSAFSSTEKILPSWTRYVNNDSKSRLLILPDSSSVMLLPGSTLLCPIKFATEFREVQLVGEAFFEIAKRPNHPFLVQTSEITTRVLGTSFNVRAYPNEPEVKVRVKNGTVVVYPQTPSGIGQPRHAITLLSDQQVIYRKHQAQLEKFSSFSKMNISPIQRVSFEFNDMPVRAILDSIARVYQLEVTYEVGSLDKCILTTTLTDVPLPRKLSIICEALGENMRYNLSESQIVIHGRPACD
jgi:transmembrane sensor